MDAPSAPSAPAEHLAQEQLFPLVWALKDRPPPPREGEGADPELARALSHLSDAFQQDLPAAQRLGPETVERLLAHTRACPACRMRLLEDGPDARPARTQQDVQSEADRAETEHRAKVKRFWVGGGVGLVTFVGAQVVFGVWRDRNREEKPKSDLPVLQTGIRQERPIDPLIFVGIALTVVAAFALADAYLIARELWIDFSRWKRAVPIIGKRWADRDKQPE